MVRRGREEEGLDGSGRGSSRSSSTCNLLSAVCDGSSSSSRTATYRSFLSLSSVSVAAPTLMRAMPPPRLATRSLSFSWSNSESDASASSCRLAMRLAMASLCAGSVTMVVWSFPMTTRSHRPSWSTVTASSVRPTSSATYVAPVAMARSCRTALRRSPKAGALMATTSSTPRILFTTSADSASPVTSSAMMNRGCARGREG